MTIRTFHPRNSNLYIVLECDGPWQENRRLEKMNFIIFRGTLL